MPKRKPDQVVRIEFALNRTDREVIERYLFFEKADKASQTASQLITAFTSTDGGLIASWFLLDIIDDWAIPGDGIFDYALAASGATPNGENGDAWQPTMFSLLGKLFTPFLAPVRLVGEMAAANTVQWKDATEEQRIAAAPFRKKINDYAKAGKFVIAGYFVAKWGDDWIKAVGGLLPNTSDIPVV